MLANDDLRLLVHLDYEHSQCPVGLVLAPAAQDPPELLPVDRVVGLLHVDEGCVLPPLLPLPGVDLVISLQMCAEVEVPSLNPVW